MKSKSSFIKSLFAVVIFLLALSSCSKSDQKKASDLLIEHAKTAIADYESFEIVQMDSLKEVYSDVYEEPELSDLYSIYYLYLDSIKIMERSIRDLDDLIEEYKPVLEDLIRRKNTAEWRCLTTFTQGNVYNHMSARDNYESIYNEGMRLANEMDKADAMRKSLKKSISNCNDSISAFRQRTIAFYNDYKPQYLGRGTVVKCRFRDENSNMKFISYQAIYNDEISELVSIEEVTAGNSQNIMAFVNGIVGSAQKNASSSHTIYQQSNSGVSRFVVIDGSQLRLRLGPSTSSDTFKWPDGTNRHPEVGSKYRYLGASGDFYKIDFKGNELWVSKQYSHVE